MGEILKILAVVDETVIPAIKDLPNRDSGFSSGNLTNILYWVYAAGGIIAVGVIIYGGIKYQLSQGQPDKTRQAAQIIAYAIAGLAVVVLAGAITAFVTGAIGGAAE